MKTLEKLTDSDLTNQLKQGSEAAFEALYDRYKGQLSANLMRMLKSPELTEELLQDLFMTLWEHREGIDPDQPIGGYLYRIAVNKVKNTYRKMANDRQMRAQLGQYFEQIYDGVDTYIHGKELHTAVQGLLAKLPPQRRLVYTLFKIEGKSYKEISAQLQISEGTVNSHIRNANKFLKTQLVNRPDLMGLFIALMMFKGIQ